MSPYHFDSPLVAIDGSKGAQSALDCAISLVERLGGQLAALIVEGKLPAYAATAGEVDESSARRTPTSNESSTTRGPKPPSAASSSGPNWFPDTPPG